MNVIPDDPWCPTCEARKYSYQLDGDVCTDCDSRVRDDWPLWPTVKHLLASLIAGVIALTLLFGPPVYAIYRLVSGGPLYATRTVTTTHTQPYGVLPEVGPVLVIWFLILLIGYGLAGGFPRPRP